MENKRGSEIFLGVVGVTTLLVAIIGATFAYFSATARSDNEAIKVQATTLSLGYSDVNTRLKVNMIPTAEKYATYSVFNESWLEDHAECTDDNGNEICSVYEFYIGNPSKTTRMEIEGSINVVTNEFQNLKFAIYDELGELKVTDYFPATGQSMRIEELDQALIGYADVEGADFDAADPKTYTQALDMSLETNKGKETNVRHYTMVIWIEEAGEDNVEEAGKIFTSGISFTTGGESGGVTGIIAVADAA